MRKLIFSISLLGLSTVIVGCSLANNQTTNLNNETAKVNENLNQNSSQPATNQPAPKTGNTSVLCTAEPTVTASGRQAYPIDPKYGSLNFLGQLFTADDCSPERISKIFGVEGDNYTLGSTIWLQNNPSQSLIATFKSIGFECQESTTDEKCQTWKLDNPVKTNNLLQLKPYYENFRTDDCRNCG